MATGEQNADLEKKKGASLHGVSWFIGVICVVAIFTKKTILLSRQSSYTSLVVYFKTKLPFSAATQL